jgi:AraC-like DNA-binding protein
VLESFAMSRAVEEINRRLLRARDAMDRAWAQPLDVAALARIAGVSGAHFIRSFRATFGETPHRYLQRRRVERSMFLLRESDRSVTDICLDVGFTSLGTFSRAFRTIVGRSPVAYRRLQRAGAGRGSHLLHDGVGAAEPLRRSEPASALVESAP